MCSFDFAFGVSVRFLIGGGLEKDFEEKLWANMSTFEYFFLHAALELCASYIVFCHGRKNEFLSFGCVTIMHVCTHTCIGPRSMGDINDLFFTVCQEFGFVPPD